jgi:hypothetical protein
MQFIFDFNNDVNAVCKHDDITGFEGHLS